MTALRTSFDHKDQGTPNTDPPTKKVTHSEINEIKECIDSHADDIDALTDAVDDVVTDLENSLMVATVSVNGDLIATRGIYDVIKPFGMDGLYFFPLDGVTESNCSTQATLNSTPGRIASFVDTDYVIVETYNANGIYHDLSFNLMVRRW